jgi:hypothetical protein
LTAGIYTVVVTDQSGCIKKDTIEIIEPAAGLSIKAAIKDLDCFGVATGGIDLTVEGGTAGFSYSWSNGATTEDLSGIAAGIYSVTVTDSNLCFLKDTFEVKQPDASLDFSLKQVDVLCYGDSSGSIDLDVTGGTKPYSYTWSNGATTEDLSNVKAGVYAVLMKRGVAKKTALKCFNPNLHFRSGLRSLMFYAKVMKQVLSTSLSLEALPHTNSVGQAEKILKTSVESQPEYIMC